MTPSLAFHLHSALGAERIQLCTILQKAGFDVIAVGGWVRDQILAHLHPGESTGASDDVDFATSARPEETRRAFQSAGWRTFTQGEGEAHGTIGVIGPSGETYEVTTYREELETDGRHVPGVRFTRNFLTDLARRDFTINAIALRVDPDTGTGELIDPFQGVEDLRNRVLRTVGNPSLRFAEDRLRQIRGIRFAARFGLTVSPLTRAAMKRSTPHLLEKVSLERVRKEWLKIADQCQEPGRYAQALRLLQEDGILTLILPEVARCEGVTQGTKYHRYDVLTHLLEAGDAAGFVSLHDARRLSPEDIARLTKKDRRQRALFRVAMTLHDIGKPETRTTSTEAGEERVHFYGHEGKGARTAAQALRRLTFSRTEITWVEEMILQHMRLRQINREPGPAALRRIARDLSVIDLRTLLAVRVADKLATGKETAEVSPSAVSHLLHHIEQMEASAAALRITDLALNGEDVQNALPDLGPTDRWQIGATLRILLDRVVERPELNTRESLRALLPEAHRSALRQGPRKKP